MSTTILAVGLLAGAGQLALTGLAAVDESHRPWPPDEISGRFGLYWLLVMGMAMPFFALIATSHGSLYGVGLPSMAVGGVIFVAGATLNVRTADAMDEPAEILGLEWRLRTDGPFRFSRNPEVAGHVGAVGGLAVAAGAWQALALAVPVIAWFVLRPVAEEPVLADRFGDRFDQYRRDVNRYVDVGRLRAALR